MKNYVYESQKRTIALLRRRITGLEAERDDAIRKAALSASDVQAGELWAALKKETK